MAETVCDDDPAELPNRRFGIPKLGFENYWYPIVTSREVGRRPRAVRLVGLVDNWPRDHHGRYVHRDSPELMLQPVLPFALALEPMPLDGDKGIAIKRSGGMTSADKFASTHARRSAAGSQVDGEMAEAEKVA